MVPLTVALIVALACGVAAALLMVWADHRSRRRPVSDDTPPASRLAVVPAVLLGLVVISVALGGLAEAVERNTIVVHWDDEIEVWAAANAGPAGTDALRVVTHFADTITVIAIAIAAVIALLIAGHRRLALFMATVVVGQWAIANLTKELVARARPDLDPLAAFNGFSFPSGHSTAAASTYLALVIVVVALRPHWWRPVLVGGAVTIAVAVAASRALLGVHWFSDVVGGVILGWTWCLVCAVVYDVLSRKPVASASTTTSSPSAT